MSVHHLPYPNTRFFSRLINDYLTEKSSLREFYAYAPELFSFGKIIQAQKSREINREVLCDQIDKGYRDLQEDYSTVKESIALIKRDTTFTITCGHQLNIFSGPLYTIYKIISTIRLAQEVEKAYPEYKIIPLFWMATEDHDFVEINHVKLYGKIIEWDQPVGGATGRIPIDSINPTLSRFLSTLGISSHFSEIEALLKKAYHRQGTLARATQSLYHQLFGKYGLVILDPDRKELKKEFSSIILQDFVSQKSNELVGESNIRLENLGYSAQVHPRPVNFFYLENGSRERIIKDSPNAYSVLNSKKNLTDSDLAKDISENPDKFSPNVVLRPLYQEKILPNLAFIGGGAEVSYWLSLKTTFDYYKVPYPALFLRNSALIIEKDLEKSIRRLGFQEKDFFKDSKELIKEYVIRTSTKTLNLEVSKTEMNELFEKIKLISEEIDPTLSQSATAIKTKTINQIRNLEKKLIRKEKDNFDIQISQIIKIKQALFPNQGLQERNSNFFEYSHRYGSEILAILLDNLNPLEKEFTIINLP